MWRIVAVLGGLLSLAACAHYGLVEAERRDVGDSYSVDPQIDWSRATDGDVELWTVNGPALEALRFYSDIEDDEPLVEPPGVDDDRLPRFRADMLASEVVELVVDSLALSDRSRLEAKNLRPARFGTLAGFRFELSGLSESGLAIEGLAVGVIHDEELNLIIFTAARSHYFPTYRKTVDKIIDSIEVG